MECRPSLSMETISRAEHRQQPSSYGIKSHRFGSQDIIAVEFANAQSALSPWDRGSYEAIAGSDDQGIAP